MTALDSNNLRMGDFVILDSTNTFIQLAVGREYISHYNAAAPSNVGAGFFTWQFKWIAPSVPVGPISFYAAGVSADSPISAPAGNVYTTNLEVMQESLVGLAAHVSSTSSIDMFPNPADHHIRFVLPGVQAVLSKLGLFSIDGQTAFWYSAEEIKSSEIDVGDVPSGIYVIQINDQSSRKVIISH